jgi:hypothetical protein
MAESAQNFFLWNSNDKNVIIDVLDANSSGINLSGLKLDWKVSREPHTAALLQKFSTGSTTIKSTAPTTGRVIINLDNSESALLRNVPFHRLDVIDTLNNRTTVTTGWITTYYSGVAST